MPDDSYPKFENHQIQSQDDCYSLTDSIMKGYHEYDKEESVYH